MRARYARLTSRSYYFQPEYHTGKSFLVLNDVSTFSPNDCDFLWFFPVVLVLGFCRENVFTQCLCLTHEDNPIFERKALQLNKLESFLLKTVIPFIRIAHCPRGSYFKVLGDLILISANVSESMEKILPLEQSLVPVSFKRKLTYQETFIEEFIEK